MKSETIRFEKNKQNHRYVFVYGYPELENREGVIAGDGIAVFHGEGWKNYELYIANMNTGKIRKLATANGHLLVDNDDIDYDAIAKECVNGINNAQAKAIRYAGLCPWGDFKNGLNAIYWELYPDGRYFADEDGFGAENNAEEAVYAIIDTDLNIIEPFRPIKDIATYLNNIRKKKRK